MKAELVPEDGGRPIPITRDVTLVGRREYCDVQLDHPSLSKRHAVLVKTDGLLILRDLISTNGTKVKGQRIRWAALLPDDRVAFGSLKFRVYLGPDDAPGPSERPRAAAAKAKAGRPPASVPVAPPVGFAAPSPLGMPSVSEDSDDWRHAMAPGRVGDAGPGLNDHELILDEPDDLILDLGDDDIVDLNADAIIDLK